MSESHTPSLLHLTGEVWEKSNTHTTPLIHPITWRYPYQSIPDENRVHMVNQTLKISSWTLHSETIPDEC